MNEQPPQAERTGKVGLADPSAKAARILIVLHDFSGGGTERVAIRLANQWALAGRAVRIFCGSEAGPLRNMVNERVAVEQAYPPLPRRAFSRIRLGFALGAAAGRFAPDVIFAPGNFHLLVLAVSACRDRSGAKTVCKISNPLLRADRRGPAAWLRRWVLKALVAQIDALVTMSPALRAEAVSLVGAKRVSVQWEPILNAGAPLPDDIERDPGLIVAAGRLEPQKNFALAIAAMTHLSRWTDARLVILGEGSERAHLTRLIEQSGLHQRVLLAGHVGDIRPWLQRAACFLMTSRYEGYPASLIEALTCGAPAIVTPCSPALHEIMGHNLMGAIVRPDAGTIACALQDILRRPHRLSAEPILLARHDEARAAASYLALMDGLLEQPLKGES